MNRATAESIGAKIRKRRLCVPWIDERGELREGMSQATLAAKLNYSQAAVSHWELGKKMPELSTQWAIAQVLRIEHHALFGPTETEVAA